jgi:hypothetical protein
MKTSALHRCHLTGFILPGYVFSQQHPSPQMGDDDSRIGMYEHDKPNELRPDDNVEQDV